MMTRRGFTLVELACAIFVFSLVIGGIATTFLGIHRMISQNILPDNELAIQMRVWREKLLFHRNSIQAGQESYGLLSTTDSPASDDNLSISSSRAQNVYFVDLEMTAPNHTMTRRERITVPVFGKAAGNAEVFSD